MLSIWMKKDHLKKKEDPKNRLKLMICFVKSSGLILLVVPSLLLLPEENKLTTTSFQDIKDKTPFIKVQFMSILKKR